MTPWTAAYQTSLLFSISWSCSNSCPMSQWCHPIISTSAVPFSFYPQFFTASESFPKCWLSTPCPKYRSFSFSIRPSNEYPGLISSSVDWFDLLAVQGALKSLQHHSTKEPILQWSAFCMAQFSHPYMTTGKTIALTIWTFVGKVMSLLFKILSRFSIAFIPRNKHFFFF